MAKLDTHILSLFSGVSNLELRSDAIENRMKIYNDANKKLQSSVFYLNRSQASVQVIKCFQMCHVRKYPHLSQNMKLTKP